MDQSEEVTLLSGDGTSGYIGQVTAIPKLCIPSDQHGGRPVRGR